MDNKLRSVLSFMLCAVMLISSFISPIYADELYQQGIAVEHDHDHMTHAVLDEIDEVDPNVPNEEEEKEPEVQPSTAAPTVVFNGPYVNGNQSCELPEVEVTAQGDATLVSVTYRDIYLHFKGTVEGVSGQKTVTYDLKQGNGADVATGIIFVTATDSNGNTTTASFYKVHVRGEYRVETYPATCTTPAKEVTTNFCAVCKKAYSTITSYSKTDLATGHNYTTEELGFCGVEGTVTKKTCGTCGYIEYEKDGAHFDFSDSYTEHKWSKDLTVVDATCEKDGVSYYECNNCGATKDVTVIPMLKHNYGEYVDHDATCTEDGYREATCTNCQSTIREVTSSALGHDYDTEAVDVTVPATHFATGKGTVHCKRCSDTVEIEIPMIPHTYEYKEISPATCSTPGSAHYVCECGEEREDGVIEIPIIPHNYTDDGNCTTEVVCTVCNTVIIEAKEHVFGDEYENDAATHWTTCTNEGCYQKEYGEHTRNTDDCTAANECGVCGTAVAAGTFTHSYSADTFVSDEEGHWHKCAYCSVEVESQPHVYVDDNDCTTEVTCNICGYVVIESKGGSHNFGTYVHVQDETGDYHIRHCLNENCNAFERGEHNFSAEQQVNVVPASCETDGSYDLIKTCEDCGYTEVVAEDEVIKSNGHVFGDWIVIESPTCESDGEKYHECNICHYREYDKLDETGHVWKDDYTIDKKATCTEDGSKSIHCRNCDATMNVEVIPATGHSFGEYVYNDDATCTEDGTESATCANCSEKRTKVKEKSAKGHSFGDYVYNNNATCTEDGTMTHICAACNYTETVEDPDHKATGHSYDGALYVYQDDATCDKDGNEVAYCVYCGKEPISRTAEGTKLNHVFSAYKEEKAPTCTDAGSMVAECDRGCGTTDTVTVDPLGHSFTNYIYNNNETCSEDGTEVATCDRDGCDKTDEHTVAGTAHHIFTTYTYDYNATCTEDGTETAVCDRCGSETFTRSAEGTALGHEFLNYVYNNDATCTEDGTETATCDREGCNETDTRVAENTALGHNYNYSGVCTRCGEEDPKAPNYPPAPNLGTPEVEKWISSAYSSNGSSVSARVVYLEYGSIYNELTPYGQIGVYDITLFSAVRDDELITFNVYAPGATSDCVVLVRDDWKVLESANLRVVGDRAIFTVPASLVKTWRYFAIVKSFDESEFVVDVPAEGRVNTDD